MTLRTQGSGPSGQGTVGRILVNYRLHCCCHLRPGHDIRTSRYPDLPRRVDSGRRLSRVDAELGHLPTRQ